MNPDTIPGTGVVAPVGAVAPVTDATYADRVDGSREPVLIAFCRAGESTCEALEPVLARVAARRPGLRVLRLETSTSPATVAQWGIHQVPTLIILDRGIPQRVLIGVRPPARLLAEVDAALGRAG